MAHHYLAGANKRTRLVVVAAPGRGQCRGLYHRYTDHAECGKHEFQLQQREQTTSDVLRDAFVGVPVILFAGGELAKQNASRNTGLLAGEAMINPYVTDEAIKYITLRERPQVSNARGHLFAGDAASDPTFVSGHSIVAWSSAAVLTEQYSRPWEQAGIYGAATAVSLTRVLAQQHFPSDVLLGSAAGWLIGRYVFRAHRSGARDRSEARTGAECAGHSLSGAMVESHNASE